MHPAYRDISFISVNVLAAGQQALANLFGGKTAMAERFAAARWTRLATGAPVLDGALVACDCRIAGVQSVGSHDLLLCEVLGVAEPGGEGGLLYFDRRYHELA